MSRVVQQTEKFATWHRDLRDMKARIAIARRIERASAGNLGDTKPVGDGVKEMRVDVGAGYRVYFVTRGHAIVILLCGGDKKSQQGDIKLARKMAKDI